MKKNKFVTYRSIQLTVTEASLDTEAQASDKDIWDYNTTIYHLNAPDNTLNLVKKMIETTPSVTKAKMLNTETDKVIWKYEQT